MFIGYIISYSHNTLQLFSEIFSTMPLFFFCFFNGLHKKTGILFLNLDIPLLFW